MLNLIDVATSPQQFSSKPNSKGRPDINVSPVVTKHNSPKKVSAPQSIKDESKEKPIDHGSEQASLRKLNNSNLTNYSQKLPPKDTEISTSQL